MTNHSILKIICKAVRYLAVAAVAVSIFSVSVVLAQIPTASISGTVHDKSGAVIQHAAVELKNSASGDTRRTTTNDSGIFNFSSIQNGDYDITISAPGFSTLWRRAII